MENSHKGMMRRKKKGMMSGKSQIQGSIYHMILFIQHFQNDKIIEIDSRLVAARG